MRCPKCGYISFDHHDTCPKCNKDISATRAQLNLPDFEANIPVLLGGVAVGGKGTAGVQAQLPGLGAALEPDLEEAVSVDLEKEGILEDEMEGFTFDLDDLTLTPEDDEAHLEEAPPKKAGLHKGSATDRQIDLAIENLEVEDLLSDDGLDDVHASGALKMKHSGGQSESNKKAFTLDLEDLELDLDLEGKK